MVFSGILEYLRVLDTTAQNPRNLGKGAFSFPGMSQSHHPKGGSHGETIWQSSVGLRGDAEVVGLCPSQPARIHAGMSRKEEAASVWEGGVGTDGASWDLSGTGLEKETRREKQSEGQGFQPRHV